MAVPLPNLQQPCSRVVLDESHFLHEKSRHLNIVSQHPFNYQVDVCMPNADESVFEDITLNKYYEAVIQLQALVHPAFVEAFVKRGRFQLTSSTNHIDTDNVVSLCPSGYLYLHLVKDTYYSLGLIGKPSAYYKRPHDKKYVVAINLKDPSFRPGTKYYQRIKDCIRRLPNMFRVVFSWQPDDEKVCPSSPSRYFMSVGYKCKQLEPSVNSFTNGSVTCCPLSPATESRSQTTPPNQIPEVDPLLFWEWLGGVICDVSTNQRDGSDYLSTYSMCLCEGNCETLSNITRLTATGMISSQDITQLLEKLQNLASDHGWCSLTVHGFSDAAVTWAGKEHGYSIDNGDNLYTFVMFPNGSYWLYTAYGSYHETN